MIKTIRGKVALWSIIIVGILNIVLSIFIYKIINKKLEDTITSHMRTIEFMAKNIARTNDDNTSVINNLYDIFGDYIIIADKDNNIINSRGNILSEEKVNYILKESNNKKSLLNLSKGSKFYIATFNYPIYIDESYYGNIVVQKNYLEEYNENYKIIYSIFIGQAIILFILVVALWCIISRFTKPINKLSIAIESFGMGKNEEDIEVKSNDEVAILAEKFNFMKNEIKEQMEIIKVEQNKNKEFFNNATHELKTPITAISGYTQILLDENILEMDEEFRDRALERMVKESSKLNNLVKNLLEISRGEVKRNLIKVEFDLGEVITSKINDINVRLIKSNIKVKTNIQRVMVKCNKEEINTIIINLLDNAIKYTAEDIISINVYEDNKSSIFEISNKIYDIPLKIRESLFEPFVKHSNDIVLEKEGITSSGLGLYICNKLARDNNSKLIYTIDDNIIKFKLIIPSIN